MNDMIKAQLIQTLAMEESRRKSRAMITYTSDRLGFVPPRGCNQEAAATKTYVTHYKPKRRRSNDSI